MKIIDRIKRWWENEKMVWHLSRGNIGWFYNRPSVKNARKILNQYLDSMLEADLITEEEYNKTKIDNINAEMKGRKELLDIIKK